MVRVRKAPALVLQFRLNQHTLRHDLAADLRAFLADRLKAMQDAARMRIGEPVPLRLPLATPLFSVSPCLVRILDRDLVAAGIARWAKDEWGQLFIDKRDERGRTVDVHALRTTFGTHLSKSGVAPRTAQAAMRHSDIKLTMGVYTDPKLLDVAGALDALPALPLDTELRAQERRATGTAGAEPTSALAEATRIAGEMTHSLAPADRAGFTATPKKNKNLRARTLVPRLVPTPLKCGDLVISWELRTRQLMRRISR
jgi:hypothetical protein